MNADVTGTFVFLSTPSARRATGAAGQYAQCPEHFYPRPPRGGRPAQVTSEGLRMLFLSTPSARRATDALPTLSTAWMISIHALREEGDTANPDRGASIILFLSTPSARRATSAARSELPRVLYFYPRPPRGGRPDPSAGRWRRVHNFYPRPPRGGRRSLSLQGALWQIISIHALREEGDGSTSGWTSGTTNFYPRPPRGGRPAVYNAMLTTCKFLSTPSARRATHLFADGAQEGVISIHALREEGDAARP